MAHTYEGFAGYTCWTPEAVQEVVPREAVSSTDAVFLATHHPCNIVRRPLGSTSGGTPVGEEDVLSTFLSLRTDLLLMPIIGQSGSGKSHLIRWLRARMPDSPNRRVIYVPKYGTSLRGVIELILEQMDDPAAAGLRESFKHAADQFSETEAPTALLDALARTLEFRSRQDTQALPGQLSAERRWLAGALPVMLRDAVFRAHLLRPGGVIRAFVEKALRGTRPGDKGEAFSFTVDDFPVSIPELGRANRDAQDVHAALSSDPDTRRLAAEMLTEQLGAAINDVFGLSGSSSLTDIMRRTREVLARADKELVILIEDFTVLQGIQRELLDALIEPPIRDGVRVLCPIRVAMAVTSGYFASLEDTIRTRAGFVSDVYVLDLPYGSAGGWSTDAVQSFVGRYLNASRLGQKRIEEETRGFGMPGNACEPCPFRSICHESFGVSAEGYGLYPFNRAALDRAVSATIGGYFDPRAVLGSVVRFTLDEQRTAIERGEFPGTAFEAKYLRGSRSLRQLSIPVRDQLERQSDGKRYATLLTFWGGCPTEVVNLESGIHIAFRLPERGAGQLAPVEPREGLAPRPASPPSTLVADAVRLPEKVAADLVSLEAWVAGSADLLQSLTNTLRSYLVDSVWSRVECGDVFFHPGQKELVKRVFNDYSVQIEGSPTRRESNAKVNFVLPRDSQVATLLRGIVLARHFGNWLFPDGDRVYRLFSNRVDEWAANVLEAVDSWRYGAEAGMSFVESRLTALALSARVLGLDGADSNDPIKVLVAAIAETPVHPAPAENERGWARIRTRAATQRNQLREELLAVVGARQGATGKTRAIDAAVLLPILSEFVKSWELPPTNPDDTILARYLRSLTESIRVDLPWERTRLQELLDKLRGYLVVNASPPDLGDLLVRAGDAAADAAVFSPPDELEPYRRECLEFKTMDVSPMGKLADLLAMDWEANRAQALAGLAALEIEQLNRVLAFCANTSRRLDLTTRRADSRLVTGGAGGKLPSEIEALLDSMALLLREMATSA